MNMTTTSPYTLEEPPTSVGRALLARAFAHWCVLHFGHSAEEVAEALDANSDVRTRRHVQSAARLLGELFAASEVRTWARPFGGGTPTEILPSNWELDDFRSRMAHSAFDPARPFDPHAEPTHWIFVDLEDFNRVVEASCADVMPTSISSGGRPDRQQPSLADDEEPARSTGDRLIRMPEVKRRTGMSASTVYRRIEQKRFPSQVPMDAGNIAAWWESEVDDWVARPR